MNQELKQKLDETLDRNEQLLHENEQLQERQKEMDRNLQNTEDQKTNNSTQAHEQILFLRNKIKKKRAELKEMCKQLQDREAINEELQCDLQQMNIKNQELQGNFDEALERNKEILYEKEELDIKHKGTQDKLKHVEGKKVQQQEIQKEENLISQDFMRNHLKLQEFYFEMNDKTTGLKVAMEKLE